MACLPRLLCADTYPITLAQAGRTAEPDRLFLELVINGRPSGEVVEVLHRGPHYEIEADTLRRLSVRTPQPAGARVAVDALPGVATSYDGLRQRLHIDVPPEWLPTQTLQGRAREAVELSDGTGLLLNYDAYTMRAQGRSTTSLWSELRYFGDLGVVSHTGIQRYSSGSAGNGYLRYDTRWSRPDPATATEFTAGDVVTSALPWSTAVRLGGVQWARNFEMRPDLVTYPLPAFAGQAAVPSAVDVFVNGFRAARHNVAPGPFTLGELPVVNGGGTASVVTTDALGRQVYTTVPFYVSTELLRPGLVDYAVAVGALRRDYGLRSFAYGRPVATGVVRRGMSDRLTLEGQAQAGRGLGVLGAGGLLRLGTWGVADASLSRGSVERMGSGWQYSAGYRYFTQRGGIGVQQLGRTAGYGDASTYADDGFRLQRRVRQVNASWNLGDGSLSAGWIDQRSAIGERNRLAFASYTTALRSDTFVSVTAGRTFESGETQLRLQLTYLMGAQTTAQVAAERTHGRLQGQANVQRSLPTDGGWGWNLGDTLGGSEQYRQGTLQYRNTTLMVQGGTYGSSRLPAYWGNVTGSLGMMDGHTFAANRITDGFALVSTQGMGDVPILYDNEPVGRTNADGYLLVPSVPAYYRGHYAIDPLQLPADVHTPTLERRAAVARGRGTLVQLPVFRVRTATITLVDEKGAPLPVGTAVTHEQGDVPTVVGWDGVVYLTQLRAHNTLQVQPASGPPCHAAFEEAAYAAVRDLVVTCRAEGANATAKGAR